MVMGSIASGGARPADSGRATDQGRNSYSLPAGPASEIAAIAPGVIFALSAAMRPVGENVGVLHSCFIVASPITL